MAFRAHSTSAVRRGLTSSGPRNISGLAVAVEPPTGAGYGYSFGAGFGYETGSGLRVDGTLDYLQNDGLTDGTNTLHLRSAVALANAYYDIPLSGDASAGGGFGAYVGGGLGAAYYWNHVSPDQPGPAGRQGLDAGSGRYDRCHL